MKDYEKRMRIVSDAIREKNLSDRELLEKALSFLQSIPYDTLQNRDLESFTGFLPAYYLLDKNIGDCDSKSVALLSIAKYSDTKNQKYYGAYYKTCFFSLRYSSKTRR